MVKKSDRVATAVQRAPRRQKCEREDSAMQSFLEECRTCMAPEDWARHFEEAERSAGEIIHIVEHFVFVLAATRVPISPRLRKSIDGMLETLNIKREDCKWAELRRLNYGKYWMIRYGYE